VKKDNVVKKQKPLHIPFPFEEAIKRALNVKPPPEGWKAYEAKLKCERKRQRAKSK
jgi:hypothetical protein